MRRAAGHLAVAAFALVVPACTPVADHDTHAMADGVTITDQWATAGDMGMAALFGTLHNAGHHDARIVSGTSVVAGRVEVHEVVPDASGSKTMRPKAGGIVVPAGGTHELAPGADHLMLMDITAPLRPGADVSVTLTFEDGTTLPVSAQIRDFAGGNEQYEPAGSAPHDHG